MRFHRFPKSVWLALGFLLGVTLAFASFSSTLEYAERVAYRQGQLDWQAGVRRYLLTPSGVHDLRP